MQQDAPVRLSRDEAKRRVREAGLRATSPRVAVLQLLVAESRPLSHSEVVERLSGRDWDQATLFRNLVKLAEVGLAKVVSRAGGISRYTASEGGDDTHVHPHFSCQSCGAVDCLPGLSIQLPKDGAWRDAIRDAELQVVGTCPDCRASA